MVRLRGAAAEAKNHASALNRDARTVAGAALRRRRGPFAQQLRQVAPRLDIPALRRARDVWAIAMVKNEADIIESTVRHLVDQGVVNFLVMDNGSDDATLSILRELERDIPGFHMGIDSEPAHYQGAKMTLLADAVRRAGATWVVPFDADEYWYGAEADLAHVLRHSTASVVEARIHNVFPAEGEGWLIDDQPQHLTKVAFRAHPFVTVGEGNHAVARPGRWCTQLRIMHLPLRSVEQFERKVTNGAKALALTNLPKRTGNHWRQAAGASDEELREQWRQAQRGAVPAMGLTPQGQLAPLLTLPAAWPPSLSRR